MNGNWYILIRRLAAYRRDSRGAAAAEMAIMLPILTIPLLNIVDLGLYAYQQMQLENAALAGAEEARSFCNNTTTKVPATDSSKCPGFSSAETSAIQSTSLGSGVSAVSGYPLEGYYCTLTTGALQLVGTSGTIGSPPSGAPSNCDAVTNHSAAAGTAPGDYIQVRVSYTFTPVFAAVSVTSLLPTTITKTTWSRLK
jgi:Flp pilus assembly protein TadG